jgi:uncharacterized membrane protein
MAGTDARRGTALERPADAETLRQMFRAGVLPRGALDAALRELGLRRQWRRYGDLLLLIVGGGLLLAGIIFFVAFNWLAMDKFVKLVGLQVLVVACAGAAWLRGAHKPEGRALLFAACLLVGVFLAAFGQVYQTGADAWELFRAWALLIALWVIASRAAEHWLLLLAVTDTAIALHLEQVHFYRWVQEVGAWLILAATQVLALTGFELGRRSGYFRSLQVWPRWLLVPALLSCLAAATTVVIFGDAHGVLEAMLAVLGLIAAVFGGYGFYRRVERDLFPLTCIGFCCAWIVTMLALRVLDVGRDGHASPVLVGLLVVGMLTLLVRQVRRWNVAMRTERDG